MTIGLEIARDRIALEAKHRTGFLDLGRLGLVNLPEELFELKHPLELNLGVFFRGGDGRWRESESHISLNDIGHDLSLLENLTGLHSLFLRGTPLFDLTPLGGLAGLVVLDCSSTAVNDLSPLMTLTNLRTLLCSSTRVDSLVPLECLVALQTLQCSSTRVSDLSSLAGLTKLQWLACSLTAVRDLAPVSHLTRLQSFQCRATKIANLGPLADLMDLRMLNCRETKVADLSPLHRLANLQWLDLSSTNVEDLSPLIGSGKLETLHCSRCRLNDMPRELLLKRSLRKITISETTISSIPTEVFSRGSDHNYLDQLRAHVVDLAAGAEETFDLKLMVLGNGRIGKTQICRRLRGENFDDSVLSTHGIVITSAAVQESGRETPTRLQIWDFGGQNIYHGTHALFVRGRAIFSLVWIPEAERTREYRHDDFIFRNEPLWYWLEYVRQFGGVHSPILIIQTQCDRSKDDRPLPIPNDSLDTFRPAPIVVHYSALNDRGRTYLDRALSQCVEFLRGRQDAIAVIGSGRAKVKRRIEGLRDDDKSTSPD